MSILTGIKGGTYFEFGSDINKVVSKICGTQIEVRDSVGSLASLRRLRKEEFVQLAIVQHDALAFIKRYQSEDREMADWVKHFKYIFSLYPEEVHLVVRKDSEINKIEDINGRRIVMGEKDSGTRVTATYLLLGLDLKVEPVELNPKAGLEKLLKKEDNIDGVFAVGGKPIGWLNDQNKLLADLTIVPIPKDERTQKIFELYLTASISNEDYWWLDKNFETAAVMSALVTFDFRRSQCENVAMVARLIKDNLEDFERFGHKKWASVKLDQPVPGWDQYKCVKDRMETPIRVLSGRRCSFSGGKELAPEECNKFSGPEKILCELERGVR